MPKFPPNTQRLLHIKTHKNKNVNLDENQQKHNYPLYYITRNREHFEPVTKCQRYIVLQTIPYGGGGSEVNT